MNSNKNNFFLFGSQLRKRLHRLSVILVVILLLFSNSGIVLVAAMGGGGAGGGQTSPPGLDMIMQLIMMILQMVQQQQQENQDNADNAAEIAQQNLELANTAAQQALDLTNGTATDDLGQEVLNTAQDALNAALTNAQRFMDDAGQTAQDAQDTASQLQDAISGNQNAMDSAASAMSGGGGGRDTVFDQNGEFSSASSISAPCDECMDPTLLECSTNQESNDICQHGSQLTSTLENAITFYQAVVCNLEGLIEGFQGHCETCKQLISQLASQGQYQNCGVMWSPLPAGWKGGGSSAFAMCAAMAMASCGPGSDAEKCQTENAGNAQQCPLCNVLKCTYAKRDLPGIKPVSGPGPSCQNDPCNCCGQCCKGCGPKYCSGYTTQGKKADWDDFVGAFGSNGQPEKCQGCGQCEYQACHNAETMIEHAVISPDGVVECQQNMLDTWDACVVDGAGPDVGGHDPCSIQEFILQLKSTTETLIAATQAALANIQGSMGVVCASNSQGNQDIAREEFIQRATEALESMSDETERFQRELTSVVELMQNGEFNADISSPGNLNMAGAGPTNKAYEKSVSDFQGPCSAIKSDPPKGPVKSSGSSSQCQDPPRVTPMPITERTTPTPTVTVTATPTPTLELATPPLVEQLLETIAWTETVLELAGAPGPQVSKKDEDWVGDPTAVGQCVLGSMGGMSHSDRGFDIWDDRTAVENFNQLDIDEDLFGDIRDCLNYDANSREKTDEEGNATDTTQTECIDVCDQCFGTTNAHCHASKKVCICEQGNTWVETAVGCVSNEGADGVAAKCCSQYYGDSVVAPVQTEVNAESELSGADLDKYCSGATSVGVLYDYCQGEGHLCCYYGLEMVPVDEACTSTSETTAGVKNFDVDDVLGTETCTDLCDAMFVGNRAIQCKDACDYVSGECETNCFNTYFNNEETDQAALSSCLQDCGASEAITPCVESCLSDGISGDKDNCIKICKAVDPDLEISLKLKRYDASQNTFFAGEQTQVEAVLSNTGTIDLEGKVSISILVYDNCNCPEDCSSDNTQCGCECKENKQDIQSFDFKIEPGKEEKVLTKEFHIPANYVNKTFKAVAEVYDVSGDLITKKDSELNYIIQMQALEVIDAYMLNKHGEKITTAYYSSKLRGEIIIRSMVFPVKVDMYLMGENGLIESSRKEHSINYVADNLVLSTEEIIITEDQTGSVLRIGVRVTQDNEELFSSVLSEQLNMLSNCAEVVTQHCLVTMGKLRMTYPNGFVKIATPKLTIVEAGFIDEQGRWYNEAFQEANAQTEISLRNDVEIPFKGPISISVRDSQNNVLSETSENVKLEDSSVIKINTDTTPLSLISNGDYFEYNSFRMFVKAINEDQKVWMEEYVDSKIFPFSEFTIRKKQYEGATHTIDTTLLVEDCALNLYCKDCYPACEIFVNPKTCSVVLEECGCTCSVS